jgi:hypothetical protein
MEYRLNRAGIYQLLHAQTPRASAKIQPSSFNLSKFMATTLMRFLSILLLSGISVAAFAAKPAPGKTGPPSPPPATGGFSDEEPEVTIVKKKDQTVEEYRVGGKLYMIKITPKVGKPYYLVDDQGDGKFSRQESLDSGLRPPRWVIHRF